MPLSGDVSLGRCLSWAMSLLGDASLGDVLLGDVLLADVLLGDVLL